LDQQRNANFRFSDWTAATRETGIEL
jgi:hypothetical protein